MPVNFYGGSDATWPRRTSRKLPGQSSVTTSRPFMDFPDGYCDYFWDFGAAHETYDVTVPLGENTTNPGANIISLTDTHFSIGEIVVPRAGVLVSATYVSGGTGIAADNTNFVTFTITNKLGAGAGSTAMLTAGDTNTTKAAGLNGITALVPKELVLSATAANLNVAAGDVLEVKAVTAGTLANAMNAPAVRLRFNTVPEGIVPTVVRTAGLAGIVPGGNVANGDLTYVITTTNETQHCRMDWGDRLLIQGNKGPIFECRLKIATSAVSTSQNMVFGLTSAFNATLDDMTYNAMFKLAATMDIRAEDDDNTTDRDDTDTTLDMTLGTYRTFAVDLSEPGYARYYVDGALTLRRTLNLSTNLLQPMICLHKTGTTAVPVPTIEWMRVGWHRF